MPKKSNRLVVVSALMVNDGCIIGAALLRNSEC